jgi:hypothetical protein
VCSRRDTLAQIDRDISAKTRNDANLSARCEPDSGSREAASARARHPNFPRRGRSNRPGEVDRAAAGVRASPAIRLIQKSRSTRW